MVARADDGGMFAEGDRRWDRPQPDLAWRYACANCNAPVVAEPGELCGRCLVGPGGVTR